MISKDRSGLTRSAVFLIFFHCVAWFGNQKLSSSLMPVPFLTVHFLQFRFADAEHYPACQVVAPDPRLLHSQEEDLRHIPLLRVSPVHCAPRDGHHRIRGVAETGVVLPPCHDSLWCLGLPSHPSTLGGSAPSRMRLVLMVPRSNTPSPSNIATWSRRRRTSRFVV